MPKLSFLEDPYGLSSEQDPWWATGLELEHLPLPKDLFGDRRDTAHITPAHQYSGDSDLDIRKDDFNGDENEMFTLEAGLIGLEDSIALGGDCRSLNQLGFNPYQTFDANSEVFRDSRSSQQRQVVTSDFFDYDDDLGNFDIPLPHVAPSSLRKRSFGSAAGPDAIFEPDQAEAKDPSITGKSGSPTRPTSCACPRQGDPSIDIFQDGKDTFTPPIKKQKSLVETPSVNCPLMLPLKETPNTRATEGNLAIKDGGTGLYKEHEAKEEEKRLAEERQRKMWEGIDPTFYEQFKDIVELI